MVNERLDKLREKMEELGIDLYYFNTTDYHMSEYVPEYFKTIRYFSGFSGSLATLLVGKEEAVIFVDGRYHLQAERECEPNGIKVVKLGTEGALEPVDYIKEYYPHKLLGIDGKRTSVSFAKKLLKEKIRISDNDIYSDIIEDRAPLKDGEIFELEEKYTGLSRKQKLDMMYYCLSDKVHVLSNLESIAYLLNLRGSDITYTPVFMAYMVIMDKDTYLFCDIKRFSAELLDELYADGVIIRPYDSYYSFLKDIKGRKILLDEEKINYTTYTSLAFNRIMNMRSIVEDMKAIKNPIEQENMKLAHIYDGVAILRFYMWLDGIDKRTINEYDAAKMISKFRLDYKAFDLSFNPIVAYNENAAQMHYSATEDNAKQLDNKGILLMDTGGQYYEGTTDITRTISLGEVDPEIRRWFTIVLKSMFNLSEAVFLKGVASNQIDILARKDIWKQGVNYRCGTGHGVGQTLAVHERIPNIRFSNNPEGTENVELKPGMITSDEPGVYFDNLFGIRCENMLLCKTMYENEYGEFLGFEHLTMVPFDLDLIDKKYLDEDTVNAINRYHETVYLTLLPYLNEEEAQYLRKKTMPL
ncbi:MAG: aminopeptidase P family N-terminal domain-containing protein [Erysipelotrichaceae bacterium]|nr:aminopeptidase P family N-terminal domain-containing protein [Erysipelotrichaceae bacterium]